MNRVMRMWSGTVRGAAAVALALALAACGGSSPEKMWKEAQARMAAGDLTAARGLLETVLEREPAGERAAEVQNALGLVCRELGDRDAAAAAFAEAMRLAPALVPPAYNAGCLALESGNAPMGLKFLRQAADLDPKDTRALAQIGEWTTRNGRWDLAKRMYFEMQKREPRSAVAATGLGRVALLEGRLPQAETFFMQALEMSKDYPPALYNLGVLHSQENVMSGQAREYFRQYLEVAKEGERAVAAAARFRGETVEQTSFGAQAATGPQRSVGAAWAEAQTALRRGETGAAEQAATRALDLAREGGDLNQRGEIIQRVLEAFPGLAAGHQEAGDYFLARGEPAKAREELMKARALDGENPMVLLWLARASAATGEFDTTVISLRQLVQLEPGNADAQWELAETYGDKLGMTGKGITAYREFETRFPADPRTASVGDRVKALEEAAAAWKAEEEAGR